MLPSTGHFKAINCPFFDSGLCERPYCHFRHVKKDVSCTLETNGEILEHLVSEAVKKVLQQKEMIPGPNLELSLVSKVVDNLLPSSETTVSPENKEPVTYTAPPSIPSYKPTPIAELKKRHIPVPYTPRNCSKVQAKRCSSKDSTIIQPKRLRVIKEMYVPRAPTSSHEYNPDVDTQKCVGYSPAPSKSVGNHSYIPSSIATLNPPTSDYIPSGSNNGSATYEPSGKQHREPEYRPMSDTVVVSKTYIPTTGKKHREPEYRPKSDTTLTSNSYIPTTGKKHREPEYRPMSDKMVATNSYIPTDKAVLQELNLDDLTSEFELLDEIISEHSSNQITVEPKLIPDNLTDKLPSYVPVTISRDIGLGVSGSSKTDSSDENNIFSNGLCSEINPTNGDSLYVVKRDSDKSKSSNKKDSIRSDIKDGTSSKTDKKRHRSKSSSHRSSTSHHKSKSKSMSSTKDDKSKDNHKSQSISTSSKTKDSVSKHSSSSTDKSSSKHKSSTSTDRKSNSKSSRKHASGSSSSKTRTSKDSFKMNKKIVEADTLVKDNDDASENGGEDTVDVGSGMYSASDDDEDAITEECFRIFQEYDPPEKNLNLSIEKSQKEAKDASKFIPKASSSKQRVAHEGTQQLFKFAPPVKRNSTNPAYECAKRYEAARVMLQEDTKRKQKNDQLQKLLRMKEKGLMNECQLTDSMKKIRDRRASMDTNASVSSTNTGKVRIAHVPNVSSLLEAKSRVNTAVLKRDQIVKRHEEYVQQATVAHTGPKGGQRVAHMPPAAVLVRPIIVPESNTKIASTVRQTHLNLLVKEFEKWMSSEDAFAKAIEAEKIAACRSKSKMLYASAISNSILRTRKEYGHVGTVTTSNTVSHSDILTRNIKGSWSVLKTKKPQLGPIQHHLERYILNEQDMRTNGFPFPHPTIRGSVVVTSYYDRDLPWRGSDRVCVRCQKHYTVDAQGFPIDEEDECLYHHGRMYRSKYDCCQNGSESAGCAVAAFHVTHTFEMTNFGFISTLPPDFVSEDDDYGVYALDCEMCYTTKGMELIRITVIDRELDTVFEKMVMPENPIIDYATRYSGVVEEDLKGVTTTLRDVQAALLTLFNTRTILVGHSLDSDMRALKLIHPTVVDTSVVFPHAHGPPKKRALRKLAYLVLGKAIQQGVDGHDSAEDALISMELMMHKITEDLKTV